MIANSKPSAPLFIKTDDLETLAREMFNGALPSLPRDPMKRRLALAREFAAAHLTVPGVAKPDAKKLAALAPAFRAIADSRQARVDSFLASLTPKPTAASVRRQLVQVLGEQALQLRLCNARHSIAVALVLLDRLEGHTAPLDMSKCDPQQFTARLDNALPGARQHYYPGGNVAHSLRGLALLAELADAVTDRTASPQAPAKPPSSPKANPEPSKRVLVPNSAPVTAESLAAAIRAEPDATKRAQLYQQFTALSEKP